MSSHLSRTTAIAAALCAFVLALPIVARGETESLQTIFDKANNAFWRGEYDAAHKLYTKLEELGVQDPVVSFNLGTTYARLGKLGAAVLEYERAQRLDPSSADAQVNLALVREHIARRASEAGRDADLAPAVSAWRAVLDRFTLNSAAYAFLVFHLGLFAVLVLRRFVAAEMPRLSLGVLAGVLIILVHATGSVLVGKWHQQTAIKEAVVIITEPLAVVEGPGSGVKRFVLEEGSRVTVLEEQGGWWHVRSTAEREGWVNASSLGVI